LTDEDEKKEEHARMKNENEAKALNERLLAEVTAEVRPKIDCPDDLALLLARLEPKAQHKMRAATLMDEALEKSIQSMPDGERAKFKRLLKNVELLFDLERAARKARVDRNLLDRWRNRMNSVGASPRLSADIVRFIMKAFCSWQNALVT
jgi:hypothetical protein